LSIELTRQILSTLFDFSVSIRAAQVTRWSDVFDRLPKRASSNRPNSAAPKWTSAGLVRQALNRRVNAPPRNV